MAMTRKRQQAPVPSGSLIVWMAGLVLGAGAGIVLVYHMLLASHSVATHPFRASAAYAKSMPVVVVPATAAAKDPTTKELLQEHDQALKDALKPSKG